MDYRVALYERTWSASEISPNFEEVVQDVVSKRDAALQQLRLPAQQVGNFDSVSCGVWVKVRTDRPHRGAAVTSFVTEANPLHEPQPFDIRTTPLGRSEFRLLEVPAGETHEQLRCGQLVADLNSPPSYHAVSHVWGSPHFDRVILVDDYQVRVTSALHEVLIRLRHRTDSIFLWIDFLCIQQDDLAERAQQVMLMSSIFAAASNVVVWLGAWAESASDGFRTLRYLAEGKAFDGGSDFEEGTPPWHVPRHDVAEGLRHILARPWFHRVWTVQEAAVSSTRTTMMCGEETISWPATFAAVSNFIRGLKYAVISPQWRENGLAGSSSLGLESVNLDGIITLLDLQLRQIRRRHNLSLALLEPDFLDLLYDTRFKESMDPRDRIYGILGLAAIRGIDGHINPDYSLPVETVYDQLRDLLNKSAKKLADSEITGVSAKKPIVLDPPLMLESIQTALSSVIPPAVRRGLAGETNAN